MAGALPPSIGGPMATQQLPQMHVLNHGAKGDLARSLQAACNRRLRVARTRRARVDGERRRSTPRRSPLPQGRLGARRPAGDVRGDHRRRRHLDRRAADDPQPRPPQRRPEEPRQGADVASARAAQGAGQEGEVLPPARGERLPREGRHARAADGLQRRRAHHPDGDVLAVRAACRGAASRPATTPRSTAA